MPFAENLSDFLDADTGFAVRATLAGVPLSAIFDAPGADALGGEVSTTQPSILVAADAEPEVADAVVIASGDLPIYLVHLAGTYSVRHIMPEPPDGAFERCFLAKVS